MAAPTIGTHYNDFSCSKALSCFSVSLTTQVTHFRNGPDPKEREMGCLEITGRRILGELCYAALLVVSLIEAVIRITFALLLTPLFLCISSSEAEECKGFLTTHTVISTLFALENSVNCTVALFQNIYSTAVRYDDLMPYFIPLNNAVMGGE
jgi:hypothetical protein